MQYALLVIFNKFSSLPEWVIFAYFCVSIFKFFTIENPRTYYRS